MGYGGGASGEDGERIHSAQRSSVSMHSFVSEYVSGRKD
jgi:hypothetical protein